MKLNINDMVSFKPTKAGWKIIQKSWDWIDRNEDGVVRMELWRVMAVFGSWLRCNRLEFVIEDNQLNLDHKENLS